MERLSNSESWDYLIEKRSEIIPALANLFDVKEDYLTTHCDFVRSVKLNNKFLGLKALNDAIERINEI
ncbi:hypothetical protein D3C87_1935570 [compost metagenome]